jgi:poly(A) polymerase
MGEAAYQVCEILHDAGFECWWIGGAVRDMALNQLPKEIDMTTSALPKDIIGLFKKSDDSAAALGTVIVSHKGHTFEITTFREDDEASDGRHPESVKFGSREKDALRRDATINAIYFDPISGDIFDPTGGENDLKERLVRLIGNAPIRLQHDALRILRTVRLRATINGQYHPETYKALQSEAKLTKQLSGTRVLQELEKTLKTSHPDIVLNDLMDLSILQHILPELAACKGIAQPKDYHHEGDVWNHLVACTSKFTTDHGPDVRLAALFHDAGKVQTFAIKERIRFDHHAEVSSSIIKSVFKRLQMPAKRIEKISWLVAHHMMMSAFKDLSESRKAHWYFHPWFKELLELFYLDIAGTDPADFALYDSIVNDYNVFLNAHPAPVKPLLSGDDVMAIMGLKPGEEVGKALSALLDAQNKKEVTTKKEAKDFLQKLYKQKE